MDGWIGVDLDGTLAEYHEWIHETHIGKPIPLMLERVKLWLAKGIKVKIVTARIGHGEIAKNAIEDWCKKHIGIIIPITNQKDYGMIELWDDRCVQVEPNTGRRIDGKNLD